MIARAALLLRHPLSVAGAIITTASAVGFLAMFLAAALGLFTNPYAGLVIFVALPALFFIPIIGGLIYMMRMNARVVDDLVVNMVDVGEETGELDTMLYKVADTYDDEVKVLTESLMSLMEPLLIIMLGGMVGFIVIALFMPLIALIQKLT